MKSKNLFVRLNQRKSSALPALSMSRLCGAVVFPEPISSISG